MANSEAKFPLGFGFIVDPGTKVGANTEKATSRPTCSPLLSFFADRGTDRGLKYFHEEEQKEEEISLFMGKIESPREEIILTRDYVPRTRTLTLNKFPPSRNSIVYFPLSKGIASKTKSRRFVEHIAAGRQIRSKRFTRIIDSIGGKNIINRKDIFTYPLLNRTRFQTCTVLFMYVKARLVYLSNGYE